jgi:DNA-binding response OmpR family regulator
MPWRVDRKCIAEGNPSLGERQTSRSDEPYPFEADCRTTRREMPMPHLSILAVTNSCEKVETLVSILALEGWTTRYVSTCRDAIAFLDEYPTGLVLCERKLSDGTWKTLLAVIETMQDAPLLVAFSNCPDESLCTETLNLGGYDIRAKRFDPNEVQRTIAAALRRSEALATTLVVRRHGRRVAKRQETTPISLCLHPAGSKNERV